MLWMDFFSSPFKKNHLRIEKHFMSLIIEISNAFTCEDVSGEIKGKNTDKRLLIDVQFKERVDRVLVCVTKIYIQVTHYVLELLLSIINSPHWVYKNDPRIMACKRNFSVTTHISIGSLFA